MALTEAQIQRYARHILLPEVGGKGQERLLAAEVRVRGESAPGELAGDYLSAAGVRVDAHAGAGLRIELAEGGVCARVVDGVVEVVASPCPTCLGEPSGPLPLEAGSIAAALAASEALRLVLGLEPSARRWRIDGAQVVSLAPAPCPHGAGA